MDDEFDYEPEPTLKERTMMLAWRSAPYALGIVVLCVFLLVACTIAARVDDPSGSSQWSATLDQVLRNLKDGKVGQ
jgi:hypothetical protein